MGLQEIPDTREKLDKRETRDQRAIQDQLDIQDLVVSKVIWEKEGNRETKEIKEKWEMKVLREKWA